jgi:predicted nucleic acid-binding protein
MPVRPIIANSTPLVALWVLERLDILRELYGEVLIPPGVQAEFLMAERALRQAVLDDAPWIKVVPLANPNRTLAYTALDRGEAEALALAEECEARLVIIDERKGRRYASRLGLPLTGTLGILLLAKNEGLIPAVAPLIDALQEAGLYLDEDLVAGVLESAGERPPYN